MLYDFNEKFMAGTDVFMGELLLDISQYPIGQWHMLEMELDHYDRADKTNKKNDPVKGSITLQLFWDKH